MDSLNFRIRCVPSFGTATVVDKDPLFSVHRNAYHCHLNAVKINLTIPKDTDQHLDQLILTLNAIEESTNETFMSVSFPVGDYRALSPQANSIHDKVKDQNKKIPKTSIHQRIRLKYSSRSPPPIDGSNNALCKKWRQGYVSFKLKGDHLPLPLPTTQNSLKNVGASAVKTVTASIKMPSPSSIHPTTTTNDTTLTLTLKHLVRIEQTLHRHHSRRTSVENSTLNLKLDQKRVHKSRKRMMIMVGATLLFLLLGCLWYPLVEKWTVVDALYFSVVTLTTVGYGDMGPSTDASKIFTSLWSFFGVALIAALISIVSEWIVDAAALREGIQKRNCRQQQLGDDDSSSSSEDEVKDDEIISVASQSSTMAAVSPPKNCCGCPRSQCGATCCKKSTVYGCTMIGPMVVCACIGIAVMMGVEKISFTDAIYWSIVTGTTVGYGDISPQEPATRLFALVYLFAAIVTTGKALSAVGDLLSVEDNTADTLLHKKLGKKGEAGVVAGGVGVPFFGMLLLFIYSVVEGAIPQVVVVVCD